MNPLTDFEKAVATENFEVVESRVGRMVKTFQRRYRWIHPNEFLSAAGVAYVEAVGTYRAEEGEFVTWILYKVDKALLTVVRNTAIRNRQWTTGAESEKLDDRPEREPEERFWLDEWLATLSPDARMVAMMVFEPPFSIHVRIAELGGYETPEAFRSGVREYLRDSGWEKERIEEAFLEIREAL